MAHLQKINNAISQVDDNPLAAGATTLNLPAGHGVRFPAVGDFELTLWDSNTYPDPKDDANMEIVRATARSTDAITITRAQAGTADVSHAQGITVALLITAANLTELADQDLKTTDNVTFNELTLNGNLLCNNDVTFELNTSQQFLVNYGYTNANNTNTVIGITDVRVTGTGTHNFTTMSLTVSGDRAGTMRGFSMQVSNDAASGSPVLRGFIAELISTTATAVNSTGFAASISNANISTGSAIYGSANTDIASISLSDKYAGYFDGKLGVGGTNGYLEISIGTEFYYNDIELLRFGVDAGAALDGTSAGIFWSNYDVANARFEFRTVGGTMLNIGAGYITATGFYGDGSGITGINAGNISSGLLALARGGTNKSMTAIAGGLIWCDADSMEVTAAGSAGQIPRSTGTTAPAWSTATYPATATTAGAYLRADGTNWITSTLILPNAATVNQLVFATATNTYGANANLTFDLTTFKVTGKGNIQSGDMSLLVGADSGLTTLTNSAIKVFRVAAPHYTNAEEPAGILIGNSGSVDNVVGIGGGSNMVNSATIVDIYAAANNTTVTGTLVARFTLGAMALTGTLSVSSTATFNGAVVTNGDVTFNLGDVNEEFNITYSNSGSISDVPMTWQFDDTAVGFGFGWTALDWNINHSGSAGTVFGIDMDIVLTAAGTLPNGYGFTCDIAATNSSTASTKCFAGSLSDAEITVGAAVYGSINNISTATITGKWSGYFDGAFKIVDAITLTSATNKIGSTIAGVWTGAGNASASFYGEQIPLGGISATNIGTIVGTDITGNMVNTVGTLIGGRVNFSAEEATITNMYGYQVTLNFGASGIAFHAAAGDTPSSYWDFYGDSRSKFGTVGIGLAAPLRALHINNATAPQIRLSTVETNVTNKSGYIAGTHYTTAEEESAIIGFNNTSTTNIVSIGGGVASVNAATSIKIYTATNNTTTTGTERIDISNTVMTINEAGNDYDVRIEGDTDQNLFKLDAGLESVGIGAATPTGKFEIETTTTFAKAALTLDQNDDDQQFIDFEGTSSADKVNNISTLGAGAYGSAAAGPNTTNWTHVGMIRINRNGTDVWFPVYT